MPRQLWLLRHADAEPHGTRPDSERRLTERGERQARLAGAAIVQMGVEFEALLSSPKERALRTAQAAAQAWSEQQRERLEVYAPLARGFDAQQALVALEDAIPLARAGGRLLMVGHEPDLSTVVAELTGARIDLKKGGLAVVRIDGNPARPSPVRPHGVLLALLRPAELALIAKAGRAAPAAIRSQ
jgi:phosphohistidine phosphatase